MQRVSGKEYWSNGVEPPSKVAIIVPFRDRGDGSRTAQLETFLKSMTMLRDSSTHLISQLHIYIMEQEDDGRLFNRGLLLNAGFQVASRYDYDNFITHDVDMIPDPALFAHYAPKVGDYEVVHLASVFDRYTATKKARDGYIGGITSFSRKSFLGLNGFPNDCWGWGGEDNALLHRIKASSYTIRRVIDGTIADLKDKLSSLKANREKNMEKWEGLERDKTHWHLNGVSQLDTSLHMLEHSSLYSKYMVG